VLEGLKLICILNWDWIGIGKMMNYRSGLMNNLQVTNSLWTGREEFAAIWFSIPTISHSLYYGHPCIVGPLCDSSYFQIPSNKRHKIDINQRTGCQVFILDSKTWPKNLVLDLLEWGRLVTKLDPRNVRFGLRDLSRFNLSRGHLLYLETIYMNFWVLRMLPTWVKYTYIYF
jgi:hypothetical protein